MTLDELKLKFMNDWNIDLGYLPKDMEEIIEYCYNILKTEE